MIPKTPEHSHPLLQFITGYPTTRHRNLSEMISANGFFGTVTAAKYNIICSANCRTTIDYGHDAVKVSGSSIGLRKLGNSPRTRDAGCQQPSR